MFDNVKQLENEIKDFEQNILASKELVQNVKSVAEAVKQQTESLNSESGRIMRELQAVPANLRSVNEEFAEQLQKETQKVNEDFSRQIQAYLSNLESSTAEVKKYHETLTTRYTELLGRTQKKMDEVSSDIGTKIADETGKINASLNKQVQQYLNAIETSTTDVKKYHETLTTKYNALLSETQKEMDTAIVKASESFKTESEKYTAELIASVEALKKYETTLNSKYDSLLKESEQLQSKVTNDITEIKNAVSNKMTILLVLVIISIVLSAVGIFI